MLFPRAWPIDLRDRRTTSHQSVSLLVPPPIVFVSLSITCQRLPRPLPKKMPTCSQTLGDGRRQQRYRVQLLYYRFTILPWIYSFRMTIICNGLGHKKNVKNPNIDHYTLDKPRANRTARVCRAIPVYDTVQIVNDGTFDRVHHLELKPLPSSSRRLSYVRRTDQEMK